MNAKEQLDAIKDIRQMMNQSVRFLSLSGLSGVFAGIYALIACAIAYNYIGDFKYLSYSNDDRYFFVAIGIGTLFMAVSTAYLLTRKKAKRDGVKMWDENVKIGLINLSIPLITGGLLCLAFIYHEMFALLAPCTLIFYGLALVGASRNTFPMIKQLGLIEIALGLANAIFLGYGMVFWMLGFGVFHMVYGIYMYFKYDRA